MANYQWKGILQGVETSGEIIAPSMDDAQEKLNARGITVIDIGVAGSATANAKKINFKKIKNKELMVFTKKFATMIQAGLPMLKTLNMLVSQAENPNFKELMQRICRDVESGNTLSEAFEKYPNVFDTVYINLLKAGETSGKLTLFLQKLVIQLEKSEKIRSKVKSALMYPIILLCVAGGVVTIMMIKVVPVFAEMFGNMGAKLPAPTQIIINISNFLRNPAKGGVLLVVLIGSIWLLKYLLRTNKSVKRKFDTYILKLPILGDIILKATLSKIAMVQGNLSAAGVSVIQALDIINKTMTNTLFKEAISFVKAGVASGAPLSSLYMKVKIIPPAFSQMLEVGEETGNMDEMFEATANYYEEEFDMMVDRLTELLEPIMIVFMGTTVGFIIVAMYMPIFKVGQMVSGG